MQIDQESGIDDFVQCRLLRKKAETSHDLVMQVLDQTVLAYHCSEKLDAKEIAGMIEEATFQAYQEQTLGSILK